MAYPEKIDTVWDENKLVKLELKVKQCENQVFS